MNGTTYSPLSEKTVQIGLKVSSKINHEAFIKRTYELKHFDTQMWSKPVHEPMQDTSLPNL